MIAQKTHKVREAEANMTTDNNDEAQLIAPPVRALNGKLNTSKTLQY